MYDHNRKVDGSTPIQASLLRPRIRCFMIIISAWWNLTSSKLKKSEAKLNPENSEAKTTPKRVWIRPMYNASVAFSCQEEMRKSIDPFHKFIFLSCSHNTTCTRQMRNCFCSSSWETLAPPLGTTSQSRLFVVFICARLVFARFKQATNSTYKILSETSSVVCSSWDSFVCSVFGFEFVRV